MSNEELKEVFETSEKHLKKVGIKAVKVTYTFDKSNRVFSIGDWVLLRMGIKNNLLKRGLCKVETIK